MPVTKQYSPKRRLVMQVVMWVILILMIGLAGLVSTHRRGVFQAKLDPPIVQEGISVQLPHGWTIVRHAREDSSLALSVSDSKEEFRELQIWKSWVDNGETPVGMVFNHLRRNGATQVGETESIAISAHPAAFAKGEVMDTGLLGVQVSVYVGVLVPPSGHAVTVEYRCLNGDSSEEGLMRRVLMSIQTQNEPSLLAAGSTVEIPSIGQVQLPAEFCPIGADDPNQTLRQARNLDPSRTMKRLSIVPIVLQSRDNPNTIRTMLSLTESGFTDSRVSEISKTEYQIDPDANSADRAVRPIRAFAFRDAGGRGFLAVFKGGDDDQWIDEAWKFLRDHASFSSTLDVVALSRSGAETVKSVSTAGLSKYFPEDPREYWLLANRDSRTIGWFHLQQKTGGLGGTTEGRLLFPPAVVLRTLSSCQGSADLRSYRSTSDASVDSSANDDDAKFQMYVKGSSQLRDGRLNLASTPADGVNSSVEVKVPENFLPGGWLIDLLPSLPEEPMLLRTDAAFLYEYAGTADLLTLLVRTDTGFKPNSDPDGEATRCKIIEVVGSGELTRWYFGKGNQLIAIESSDHFRLVTRDEADVKMSFSRSSAMRP